MNTFCCSVEYLKGIKNLFAIRPSWEFIQIHELCLNNSLISYEIIDLLNRRDDITVKEMIESGNHPPIKYIITYQLKSIVGISSSNMPIFGNYHQAEVALSESDPTNSPKCTMLTDIWHPNIKSTGYVKGKICINQGAMGEFYSLATLIVRIAEYLQWKNYHATGLPPYPEDHKVAKWVREFAEPNNIVNKHKNIFVDNSEIVFKEKNEAHPKHIHKKERIFLSQKDAQDLKHKIAEGLLDEVLKKLRELQLDNKRFNELAIITSRFKENNKKLNLNTIAEESYNLSINKIRKSTLEFIDELSEEQIVTSASSSLKNARERQQIVLKKKVTKETIDIIVRLAARGDEIELEVPLNMVTKNLTEFLLDELGIPKFDNEGNRLNWEMMNFSTKKVLDENKSMKENKVKERDIFIFFTQMIAG